MKIAAPKPTKLLRPGYTFEPAPQFNPLLPGAGGVRFLDATRGQIVDAVDWYRARARVLMARADELEEALSER